MQQGARDFPGQRLRQVDVNRACDRLPGDTDRSGGVSRDAVAMAARSPSMVSKTLGTISPMCWAVLKLVVVLVMRKRVLKLDQPSISGSLARASESMRRMTAESSTMRTLILGFMGKGIEVHEKHERHEKENARGVAPCKDRWLPPRCFLCPFGSFVDLVNGALSVNRLTLWR